MYRKKKKPVQISPLTCVTPGNLLRREMIGVTPYMGIISPSAGEGKG